MASSPTKPRSAPRPVPVGLTLLLILVGSGLLLSGVVALQVVGGGMILVGLAAPILRLPHRARSSADRDVLLAVLRSAPVDDEPMPAGAHQGAAWAWREYREQKAVSFQEARRRLTDRNPAATNAPAGSV